MTLYDIVYARELVKLLLAYALKKIDLLDQKLVI